jgi:MFS family permease
MPVLIGMRCLQAIGSSAVISVGAGSLADMYEVHERGQKVGLHVPCSFSLLP